MKPSNMFKDITSIECPVVVAFHKRRVITLKTLLMHASAIAIQTNSKFAGCLTHLLETASHVVSNSHMYPTSEKQSIDGWG
jgi:hypothetical protein